MKKFAFVAAFFVLSVGFAMAEEFGAVITKVEGDKVTFHKVKRGKKGEKGEKGEAQTMTVAKDAKIVKGKFNAEDKKLEAGEALDNGLKNERFTKEARVQITTDADNKTITQIISFGERKKKE